MLEQDNQVVGDCPDASLTPEEREAEERAWEARLERLATEASAANRPRMFTICDDNPPTNDEIVYAWGFAFDDEAVIYRRSRSKQAGHVRVTDSPERALRLYSLTRDVRLVWLS